MLLTFVLAKQQVGIAVNESHGIAAEAKAQRQLFSCECFGSICADLNWQEKPTWLCFLSYS